MPHGMIKNAWRCSRIVVLPEYQGLGLGFKLTKYMFSMYPKIGRKMYIKTINPALVGAFKRDSENFRYIGFNETPTDTGNLAGRKKRKNKAHSFQYIGAPCEDDCSIVSMNRETILDNNMTFDF